MTDITYERALRQGAQRMAALLASELPETVALPSPEFTRRMEPVVQQRGGRPPENVAENSGRAGDGCACPLG